MTTVLQFTETDPSGVAVAQGTFLALINTGSTLTYRAQNDDSYLTQPFGPETWKPMVRDPTTFWADWGAIYAQLGEIGQQQAAILVGTSNRPGLLTAAPLPGPHAIQMRLLEVADLVAGGYVATPVVNNGALS